MNIKSIVNKRTLVGAAGLGVGSLAADVVTGKVAPMVLTTEASLKFAPAIPILAGLLLGTSKGLIGSVGNGMVANGTALALKSILPDSLKSQLGIGNVMMGSTMLSYEPITPVAGSNSFDFTNEGEMDY